MNNLLLLAGLVLVVCLMNSKDLMKSDLVKSFSSKVKSMKMDDTTLLVVIFVVVVLFMCMSKKVEGFSELNNLKDCDDNAPNKYNLSVVDNNNNPLFNYVTLCLTGTEKDLFTRNGKVTNISNSNESLSITDRSSTNISSTAVNNPTQSVMNK